MLAFVPTERARRRLGVDDKNAPCVEFGPETMLDMQRSGKLKTLLLVVTRNVTTDSPWPISSNPHARFNDESLPDCNLKVPLWKLVRASTAAPTYLEPERIDFVPGDPSRSFVFEDGGVTPYNNPAFLLYRMATAPDILEIGQKAAGIIDLPRHLAPFMPG